MNRLKMWTITVKSDRDGSLLVERTLQSRFNEGKSVKGVNFCASAGLWWGWGGGCKL